MDKGLILELIDWAIRIISITVATIRVNKNPVNDYRKSPEFIKCLWWEFMKVNITLKAIQALVYMYIIVK